MFFISEISRDIVYLPVNSSKYLMKNHTKGTSAVEKEKMKKYFQKSVDEDRVI